MPVLRPMAACQFDPKTFSRTATPCKGKCSWHSFPHTILGGSEDPLSILLTIRGSKRNWLGSMGLSSA